jgi:ubiquinone/menaquinone biosynthesis C-methylase UbiE
MVVKTVVRRLCPPVVWDLARVAVQQSARVRSGAAGAAARRRSGPPEGQDLAVYWDPEMAKQLETWGAGNAWNEIQLLLATARGRVLDIACGTGTTIELLARFDALEVHGCDISNMLLQRALDRGIAPERLRLCDATATDYADDEFDYAYTIGSLEHFTEEGIGKVIAECHRIVRHSSFHMVPVARSGRDEGWVKRFQSYFNNSSDWWLEKFRATYETVYVLDSSWNDAISLGKWFVCTKRATTGSGPASRSGGGEPQVERRTSGGSRELDQV